MVYYKHYIYLNNNYTMSHKENIIDESEQTEEIIEADAIDDSDVEVIEISDDSDDIPHSPTFSETEELVKAISDIASEFVK